jgi:hypothetical protein
MSKLLATIYVHVYILLIFMWHCKGNNLFFTPRIKINYRIGGNFLALRTLNGSYCYASALPLGQLPIGAGRLERRGSYHGWTAGRGMGLIEEDFA